MTSCCACDAKNVKTGCCGYCRADLCEDCCRADCDWSEEFEDLCCLYCWLEHEESEDEWERTQEKPIEELKRLYRAPKPKPAPRKFILKLKGGKVISKTEIKN